MNDTILKQQCHIFLPNLLIFILILDFSAVCPYLALETCRQWRLSNKTVNLMRNGKMPTVTIEQAQRNFIKVCFSLRCVLIIFVLSETRAHLLYVVVLSIIPLCLNVATSNKEFDRSDPYSHVKILMLWFHLLMNHVSYIVYFC